MRNSRLTVGVFQIKKKEKRKKKGKICDTKIKSNAEEEDPAREIGVPFLSQNTKYHVVSLIIPDLK